MGLTKEACHIGFQGRCKCPRGRLVCTVSSSRVSPPSGRLALIDQSIRPKPHTRRSTPIAADATHGSPPRPPRHQTARLRPAAPRPPAAACRPRDEPPPPVLLHHPRGALAPQPAVAALEDRLAARDRDIQELLVDNQRFAATHVALQQQLITAQHELRAVSIAATKARAEREAEVRAVAEQSARIEAEARTVVGARAEVEQVHADVRVLAAARTELMDRLQVLREQLARAQAESSKADGVRAQIETMRREIQKGRAAVEFEKKAHADNLEQSKAMEKNMISVASEIEKLRGELVNVEKWATAVSTSAAVANPGYAATYGNSEATYATMHANSKAAYAATSYSDAYSTNQAHTRPDGNPHYMAPPVHYAHYEGQHTNVQR